MVVDKIDHDGHSIQVILRRRGSELEMYLRYDGGGLVNGFTYSIHNVSGLDAEEASGLEAIQIMAKALKSTLDSGAWDDFTKASGGVVRLH